jgi:hypothetical protein
MISIHIGNESNFTTFVSIVTVPNQTNSVECDRDTNVKSVEVSLATRALISIIVLVGQPRARPRRL